MTGRKLIPLTSTPPRFWSTSPPPPTQPPPKASSTVLLLAPTEESYAILLLQRSHSASFMPGAYVFPGGVAEDSDATTAVQLDTTPEKITAVRELFEEAGLLLASGCELDPEEVSAWRAATLEDPSVFASVVDHVETRGGSIEVDALVPWARWVTPDKMPKRYDTAFYLGLLAQGIDASAAHCDRETISSAWLSPEDALAAAEAGDLVLPPPQWLCLHEIATFGSFHALAEYAGSGSRVVAPITPKWHPAGTDPDLSTPFTALPGDALHDSIPGPSPHSKNRMAMVVKSAATVGSYTVSSDLLDLVAHPDESYSPFEIASIKSSIQVPISDRTLVPVPPLSKL